MSYTVRNPFRRKYAPVPVVEDQVGRQRSSLKYRLDASHSYLVRDRGTAIEAFSELCRAGRQTLLISSMTSGEVEREVKPAPTLLRFVRETGDKNAIAREDLLGVSLTVKGFLESTQDPVVFLQCVDTLLEYNGFSPLLRLVQGLDEAIATKRGTMLLYVPSSALAAKEDALLRSETTAMPAPD